MKAKKIFLTTLILVGTGSPLTFASKAPSDILETLDPTLLSREIDSELRTAPRCQDNGTFSPGSRFITNCMNGLTIAGLQGSSRAYVYDGLSICEVTRKLGEDDFEESLNVYPGSRLEYRKYSTSDDQQGQYEVIRDHQLNGSTTIAKPLDETLSVHLIECRDALHPFEETSVDCPTEEMLQAELESQRALCSEVDSTHIHHNKKSREIGEDDLIKNGDDSSVKPAN